MVKGIDCVWPALSEMDEGKPLIERGLGTVAESGALTAVFPVACTVSVALTPVPGVTEVAPGVIDIVKPWIAGTVKFSVAEVVTDGFVALVTLMAKLSGVPGAAMGVDGTAQTPTIAVAPAGMVIEGTLVLKVNPGGTPEGVRLNVSADGPVF